MRFCSWVFLAAAAVLLLASGWSARHPFTVLTQWKTTDGSLLQSALTRDHDSDGFLTFRIRAAFRYSAGGKEQNGESVSYFDSSSVGVMKTVLTAYNAQPRH